MSADVPQELIKESNNLRYFTDHVGIVSITDPAEVAAKALSYGFSEPHKGAVYCTCPELGFEGDNLLYCRYGMSIPYIKVLEGDKLWIRPTIGRTERWIYTGFCDCGDRSTVDPGAIADTQGLIISEAGYYMLKIGSAEFKIVSNGTVTINDNFEVIV